MSTLAPATVDELIGKLIGRIELLKSDRKKTVFSTININLVTDARLHELKWVLKNLQEINS